MNEIWKDIKNYEGLYKVSNTGKVRSIERYVKDGRTDNGTRLIKGRLMRLNITNKGYYRLQLTDREGVRIKYAIARLVGVAYVFNPFNKPQINHIDGNKENNHAGNLEWCTQSENVKHAYDTGLMKADYFMKPVRIYKGNLVLYFKSATDAAKYIGCKPTCVSDIANPNNKNISIYGWQAEYINIESPSSEDEVRVVRTKPLTTQAKNIQRRSKK